MPGLQGLREEGLGTYITKPITMSCPPLTLPNPSGIQALCAVAVVYLSPSMLDWSLPLLSGELPE